MNKTRSGELCEHAQKFATPFRTSLGYPWAIISDNSGYQRAFPVSSYGFRFWLKLSFQNEHSVKVGSSAIDSAIRKFYAFAQSSDLAEADVATRIAWRGERNLPKAILLNLGNKRGEAVEITPGGRHIADAGRAKFITASSSLSLPHPIDNSLTLREHLKSLLHLDGTSLDRVVVWLFAALRPAPPYPVLVVSGPPASGKTILLQMLRYIIDPSATPIQELPETVHTLLSQALHNAVLAYDEPAALPKPLLQSLERLACGAGLGGKSAAPLNLGRPVMLTSKAAGRELIAGAISVELPATQPENVVSEPDLAGRYHDAAPAILGTLCDAASAALSNIAVTKTPADTRLPDVHQWTMAAAAILGLNNEQIACALANNRIVDALRALLDVQPEWSGAASELLARLDDVGYGAIASGAAHLLDQINSVSLPQFGVNLEQIDIGKGRLLRLTRAARSSVRRGGYRMR